MCEFSIFYQILLSLFVILNVFCYNNWVNIEAKIYETS